MTNDDHVPYSVKVSNNYDNDDTDDKDETLTTVNGDFKIILPDEVSSMLIETPIKYKKENHELWKKQNGISIYIILILILIFMCQ